MKNFVQRLIVNVCPAAKGVLEYYVTDSDEPPRVIRLVSHHTKTKTRMVQVGAAWLSNAIQREVIAYDGVLMNEIQLGKTLFDSWSELTD
jgi:hypothetical protein